MKTARRLAVPCLALAVAATPAAAQTGTDVPDTFRIELGGFNVAADTNLHLSSPDLGGTDINFETDLDLPETSQRGFVEAYWRAGRRHLVSVSFSRLHREGEGAVLDRTISWGGVVYPIGVNAVGRMESDYLSGAYRFAVFRNDSFEIGPAIGFGYLWITAGLTASGNVGGTPFALDREETVGSPTGNVGAYLSWWPARRVQIRGDFRYIVVNLDDAEASLTDARAGVTFYPWSRVGIGGQYLINKFRYDRGVLATDISGDYQYQGIQVLLSFAF
jgi:hypothetical protein